MHLIGLLRHEIESTGGTVNLKVPNEVTIN